VTVTETPVASVEADDSTVRLEAKIDQLTRQVAILTREAERQARQREAFEELRDDLLRISGGAMDVATRELEELSQTADLADTVRLLRRLVEVAPTLERGLVLVAQLGELVDDAAPLGGDVMASLVDRLALAEEKGYFTFARAGLGVVDRVVTNFGEDDVEQLGDNVVTILETIREITQPEMIALLGRMVAVVHLEQEALEGEPAEPPSLWSLLRQVRDPDVRRGMARALHTLRTVSAETTVIEPGAS
jgi:uncharacterized protein YjgD (DUF1641 family)